MVQSYDIQTRLILNRSVYSPVIWEVKNIINVDFCVCCEIFDIFLTYKNFLWSKLIRPTVFQKNKCRTIFPIHLNPFQQKKTPQELPRGVGVYNTAMGIRPSPLEISSSHTPSCERRLPRRPTRSGLTIGQRLGRVPRRCPHIPNHT